MSVWGRNAARASDCSCMHNRELSLPCCLPSHQHCDSPACFLAFLPSMWLSHRRWWLTKLVGGQSNYRFYDGQGICLPQVRSSVNSFCRVWLEVSWSSLPTISCLTPISPIPWLLKMGVKNMASSAPWKRWSLSPCTTTFLTWRSKMLCHRKSHFLFRTRSCWELIDGISKWWYLQSQGIVKARDCVEENQKVERCCVVKLGKK